MQEGNKIIFVKILAANAQETVQWFHGIPVPSLGTKLDPEQLRFSIALHMGQR